MVDLQLLWIEGKDDHSGQALLSHTAFKGPFVSRDPFDIDKGVTSHREWTWRFIESSSGELKSSRSGL
jgi:hypothetical protein